jgi:predicted TIM-barrel fold metal-dependent hydrolase
MPVPLVAMEGVLKPIGLSASLNRFTEPIQKRFPTPNLTALPTAPHVDIHQHLWPPQLLAALRARGGPPRLKGRTLKLANETEYRVDAADHDPAARARQAAGDGIDLVVVSLSSPLGIELLPAGEAHELLAAYHDGALALPPPFRAWAAACLSEVDADSLARELARGFVGLQLPANALLDSAGYARAAPLLEVLEDRGLPLLIHPGLAAPGSAGAPAWWPAIVDYVAQMHAAWFALCTHGRRRHPHLRVCFAMLAGLAPLHGERYAARAGARTVQDGNVFLDISSYGPRAIDATLRVLGIDALVNGSDRPYAAPVNPDLGAAASSALRSRNPLALLDLKEVSDAVPVASGAQP